MNCPWHPSKRVVSSCKECGADFCIECVRETDQTTLCPDCYRRKLNEIAREFTEPAGAGEEGHPAGASALRQERPVQPSPQTSPFDDVGLQPAPAPVERKRGGRRWSRGKREKPAEMPPVVPHEDFLSQGPDEDFSKLAEETNRIGRRHRGKESVASPVEGAAAAPEEEGVAAPPGGDARGLAAEEAAPPRPPREETPKTKAAAPSEDRLLDDVMFTLLKPEAEEEAVLPEEGPQELVEPVPAAVVAGGGKKVGRELSARAAAREERKARRAFSMGGTRREKSAERWAFLSQPRCNDYTLVSTSWWRAAIFIALMLLLGAVLWAVPNAYIIPKDQEYGIHAVLVGLILGLAFWWKAGRKHGTKLAVQAAITTFFALFIGEFLHWFLIITKYDAFRKIFFDFISFRFLWENGADILRYTMEAMFPIAFLWLLILPTLTAFIVGFGLPPIPEIFFHAWHALKGRLPEEKEASHGLES